MLPVENSLAGSVHSAYDLLLERDLRIWGEVILRVRHALLAPPGTTLADLQRVRSHPQALAQCAGYLARHGLEPVPQLDTAGSARIIAEEKLEDTAAIASRRAANLYDLRILAYDIQDLVGNATRFFVVGKEPAEPRSSPVKVSLVFSVPDVPGALYEALGVFARRSLNLSKVESRSDRQRHWKYLFYLDYTAPDPEGVPEVLEELSAKTDFLRLLGIYETLCRENDV